MNPRTFNAQYPGICAICGYDFQEDDIIGYVDDEICCGACCEDELG